MELLDRPESRRRRRSDQTGAALAAARRGCRPVHPRLLQVRQLRRRQHQRNDDVGRPGTLHPDPRAAADRDLVLRLRVHQLHHRRLPWRHPGDPQPDRLRSVRGDFPAPDRRPRVALSRPGRPVQQPHAHPRQVLRGLHAVHAGFHQEGLHRRHPGGGGRPLLRPAKPHHGRCLARRPGLHRAAVLRLQRLQRHGYRPGPDDGLPLHGKLQAALHQPVDHRVLAALAHQPVDLAARLPVHHPRR
ncbi:hypothetical protein D9M73_128350 [compost metagenome]